MHGIKHGLGKGKQGFARAVGGQYLRCRINGDAIASLQPVGTGLAQGWRAGCSRVACQPVSVGDGIAQRLLDEERRGMARLANAQADGTISRVGRDTRKQLAQPLERVGLQQVKTRIHGWR